MSVFPRALILGWLLLLSDRASCRVGAGASTQNACERYDEIMKPIAAFFALLLLSPMMLPAADAPPLRVVMFSGSSEYNSNESLAGFKKLLEEKYHCRCALNVVEEKGTKLPGIEELETADVAIFFTRRVSLSADQLAKVKAFIAAGKGVVGVRTASHGFQTWLEFDPQVLGGSYDNHYGKDMPAEVSIDEKGKDHPILAGVKPFTTTDKLYKNPKLAEDATLLLRAKAESYSEPVAWAREAKAGERGRVFYTSLGTPKDFENAEFRQMLANAVLWVGARGGK
jgi:type 1 glutamine amidotransferase